MKEKIEEEVSVVMYYSAKQKRVAPYLLKWKNRDYELGEVDYYHHYIEGKDKLIHVFELADRHSSIWFRLRLDSSNLHWTLEATHDGLAS